MKIRLTLLALLAILAGRSPQAFAAGPASCPGGDQPVPQLIHTATRLAADRPVVVVAVGSSSTRGWLASDPAHSYPALLQALLNQAFPHAAFSVINRGVNGEDAAEEVLRLDTDVLAVHPDLVIWQVGANGALRAVDPAVFARLVSAGIAKLKSNSDVILMDNQRTARVMAAPENDRIDHVLAMIASEQRVGLFQRSTLMDGWKAQGRSMQEFTASDGLHMNDLGYRCVAQALSRAIAKGLEATKPAAVTPEPAPGPDLK